MLFEGLRSKEVLDLNRSDLLLEEAQIRVRGKGHKTRLLPLAPEAVHLLDHYLRLERPPSASTAVFVSLKGRARGARMTPADCAPCFGIIARLPASPSPTRTASATPLLRTWCAPASACPRSCS